MARSKKDPEAIERDIEATRDRIDSTLSELGDRLSPGQLLDQALAYVRDGAAGPRRFASNLGRTVQDNPVPVALVGIGLAWLAFRPDGRSDGRWRDAELGEEGSGEEGPGALQRASGAAQGAASAAAERVRQATARTRQAKERVRVQARHGAERARSAWAHVLDEQPLVLGLAGLAIGAALGGSLPATESEDAVLGASRDDLVARGARAARESAEAVRERAERAGAEHAPEERGEPRPGNGSERPSPHAPGS
jgi:hypothetical protein